MWFFRIYVSIDVSNGAIPQQMSVNLRLERNPQGHDPVIEAFLWKRPILLRGLATGANNYGDLRRPSVIYKIKRPHEDLWLSKSDEI